MNLHYWNRYLKFIEWCDAQDLPESEYTEKHHIIPKCWSGDNSEDNLIRLTARQHFIAHVLLAKATNCQKLWASVQFSRKLCNNSKFYELIRKSISKSKSEYLKNKKTSQILGMRKALNILLLDENYRKEFYSKGFHSKESLAKRKNFYNSENHSEIISKATKTGMAKLDTKLICGLKSKYTTIRNRLKKGYYNSFSNGKSYRHHNTPAQIDKLILELKDIRVKLIEAGVFN